MEFLEKQGVKIKEIIKSLQQFIGILTSLTEKDELLFLQKVVDKNTIANWKIDYNLVEFLVNFDCNLDVVVKHLNDHGVATDLTDGAKKIVLQASLLLADSDKEDDCVELIQYVNNKTKDFKISRHPMLFYCNQDSANTLAATEVTQATLSKK
jgi:hypothetical protein